jgi:hypothetical protein
MAPITRQGNTTVRTETADLHLRSTFLPASGSTEHLSTLHERPDTCVRLTRRTHPCYRRRLVPGLGLYLRQADSYPVVAVTETETASSIEMTPAPSGSVTLHANIIPLTSSFATANSPLQHQKDPSNSLVALIALLGVITGAGIILVAHSWWNWKRCAPFKGLKSCCRYRPTSKNTKSILCKETSFVGADCDNLMWTTTRAVHMNDFEDSKGLNITSSSVRSSCAVKQLLYRAPSSLPEATEESADILSRQSTFEADCKSDDFHGRLQVEEDDIALALTIALRDLSPLGWDVDAASTDQLTSVWNSMRNLDDASIESAIRQVDNELCTLGSKNRPRQASDASTTSQETTTTDVIGCFSSASSSRSSMTSYVSIDGSDEEEGSYELKRAQTQSVEIKKGVLVAWQCRDANTVTITTMLDIPSSALGPLPVSPLTLDNSRGVISSWFFERSLTSGGYHSSPTVSSLVRESSRGTTDTLGTSLAEEGDHIAYLHPVPYLIVTCPSTSTMFTFNSIGSSISVDLSDFPFPPSLADEPTMVQKRSTVEQLNSS